MNIKYWKTILFCLNHDIDLDQTFDIISVRRNFRLAIRAQVKKRRYWKAYLKKLINYNEMLLVDMNCVGDKDIILDELEDNRIDMFCVYKMLEEIKDDLNFKIKS